MFVENEHALNATSEPRRGDMFVLTCLDLGTLTYHPSGVQTGKNFFQSAIKFNLQLV